uniref:Sushi domain-containing protein n=1 Tax=Junco hyemalis TaxID=40217 RepID=A0A8C5I9E8_JUNHY
SHLHGDFTFGSTCAFSCQTGFVLMGSDSRKCTATGTWTGDAARCEGRAAATAQGVTAVWSPRLLSELSLSLYSCSHQIRECTALGTWTGDPTHCKGKSCDLTWICCSRVPVLLICSHVHGNFTYNSTCIFSCEEGFVRMGAEVLQCEATGNWTRDPPVCAGTSAPLASLAVAGLVLSGGLIALLAKRLSDRGTEMLPAAHSSFGQGLSGKVVTVPGEAGVIRSV